MPQVTVTYLAVLLSLTAVAAPTVEQCVSASSAAQREQKSGSYLSARRQLEVCASVECPVVVQNDCTKWLAEVLAATPSLVVVARIDGVDQRQARVLLDGHLWQAELSGRPQEVEPGVHDLTVTVGAQTRLQKLLVNVGEKNRLVVFDFSTPAVADGPSPGPAPQPSPPPTVGRGAPVLPVVFSGLAVAGATAFAVLGLTGRASLEALTAQECAPTKTCNPAQVADVQRRFLVADVALGVGVVSAVVAAWQWWAWARAPVTVAFDGQRASVVFSAAF